MMTSRTFIVQLVLSWNTRNKMKKELRRITNIKWRDKTNWDWKMKRLIKRIEKSLKKVKGSNSISNTRLSGISKIALITISTFVIIIMKRTSRVVRERSIGNQEWRKRNPQQWKDLRKRYKTRLIHRLQLLLRLAKSKQKETGKKRRRIILIHLILRDISTKLIWIRKTINQNLGGRRPTTLILSYMMRISTFLKWPRSSSKNKRRMLKNLTNKKRKL